MGNSSAFWITPKGQIIEPSMYHIVTVVKFPEKFGETKSSLQSTFDKYNEPMDSNIEGKAREEILERVVKRGFIRIRLGGTGSNQKWSIQLFRLTKIAGNALWMWAKQVTDKKMTNDKYADVIIHQLHNNKMTRTSLDVIASGETIREKSSIEFSPIIQERDVGDMIYDYETDSTDLLISRYIK